jgi:PAS domain S-box-containing protein
VVITDPKGTILYVNPAFGRVSGYSPEEAIGQNPRLLRSGLQPPAFYADMWRTIKAGQVWRGELVNRRRDGNLFDAELTIAPVVDDSGAITNFCAIQRDVTARVAAERHLRELNAKLAETDRLKDEFLAAFSHELRTPLNIIMGYTDLLLETTGQADEEARLFLDRIQKSALGLTALINETLDLARLRIGAMQVKPSRVDVAALARSVVDGLVPLAEHKGLGLHLSAGEGPLEADLDAGHLRQILTNLIDNAIKFTEQGGVTVTLTADDERLAIEVCDTGIGIEPADVPRVFEDFRQLDGSPSRLRGGCGLGLALTGRLLDLMGGDISIESTPGQGSRFSICLPRHLGTPCS